MKKLRENIWQLIGAILAIIAIFATYDVFIRSKPNKELQIVVESTIPLIDVKPEAASDIQVLYKGQQIDNLVLLQLRVENSGNQPITESDYSRNILFSFPEDSEIVDVAIASSIPPNLDAIINTLTGNEAELKPILLNSEDSFIVRFILVTPDSNLDEVNVDGRIVGVKNIQVVQPSTTSFPDEPWVAILLATLGAVVSIASKIASDYLATSIKRLKSYFSAMGKRDG